MAISVIIPAGGHGQRMESSVPKQLLPLKGKAVIFYTLQRFLMMTHIREIIIPVHKDSKERIDTIIAELHTEIPIFTVPGGKERQDSVWSGMLAASETSEFILVHDAVRPFFSQNFIHLALEQLKIADGAVAGIPVTNTTKRVKNSTILETIPRDQLYEIQTPQMFRRKTLFKAFHSANTDSFYGTDEAMLVERIGGVCKIISDTDRNIKITRPLDIQIAGIILKEFFQ